MLLTLLMFGIDLDEPTYETERVELAIDDALKDPPVDDRDLKEVAFETDLSDTPPDDDPEHHFSNPSQTRNASSESFSFKASSLALINPFKNTLEAFFSVPEMISRICF